VSNVLNSAIDNDARKGWSFCTFSSVRNISLRRCVVRCIFCLSVLIFFSRFCMDFWSG